VRFGCLAGNQLKTFAAGVFLQGAQAYRLSAEVIHRDNLFQQLSGSFANPRHLFDGPRRAQVYLRLS